MRNQHNMSTGGLIFIPDISGFTRFVTENEIRHSNHIISELIEVLLEANRTDLQVAEIEGDAVLFYKMGQAPLLESIISQAQKMFIDFHTYLNIIERDTVCQCGACKTVSQLTLKFVAHFGELSEVRIHSHRKIMGGTVILAHKLLKNSINSREYILVTDELLNTAPAAEMTKPDWLQWQPLEEQVENFGPVRCRFSEMSELRKRVPRPDKLPVLQLDGKPVEFVIEIDAPLAVVHRELIDNESKVHWAPGMKEMRTEYKINRINASHVCVFDDQEIVFVTIKNQVHKKSIVFVEKASSSLGLNFVNDFKLEPHKGGTRLSLRIVLTDGQQFSDEVVAGIRQSMNTTLAAFKKHCESVMRPGGTTPW